MGLTCSVQASPAPLATLVWDSAPGELFRVLYSNDFSTWHDDLPGSLVTGLPGQSRASFTDQIDSLDQRYYSVIRVTQ